MRRVEIAESEQSRKSALLERAAIAAALAGYFTAGYFGVGLLGHLEPARELRTYLDDKIPFVACSVWVYLWVFPNALAPLFAVRCSRLMRRTALAYATAISASLILFITFPVTSAGLRVSPKTLSFSSPSQWAVYVLYSLDPPFNLFPSLHLSIAALAAYSAWKASKLFGAALFVGVGLLSISVCTVKQHFLLDVLGGLALAALAGTLILRPYQPMSGVKPAYSWLGPISYLAFLVFVYTGFFVAYILAS